MKDLTLQSELYNNLKFNMHKLILEIPEDDSEWLSRVFAATREETEEMLNGFRETVSEQCAAFLSRRSLPAVHDRKTVAFIGDSITSDRESYMNILRELYRDEEKLTIVDAAISGDKSDDAKMKFFFRVLNHQPDIVHIMLGTNDMRANEDSYSSSCLSAREYEDNIDYLISILQERGASVILSTIPPASNKGLSVRFPDDHWFYKKEDIDAVNEAVARQAAKHDAILNDMRPVYSRYQAEEILLQDGLHLNALGQSLLLDKVASALEKCL